jgi:manganese transport protein
VFFAHGQVVTELGQAHSMLDPLMGTALAGGAFALALLCSGQSSTLTGTLAGQVIMEGFIRFRLRPWVRRLITRAIAIIPAAITIAIMGAEGSFRLLILSQVVLSLQLPFAIIPLLHLTGDRRKMGDFVNPMWVKILGWTTTVVIVVLNIYLVHNTVWGWIDTLGDYAVWMEILVIPVTIALTVLLLYLMFGPFIRGLYKPAAEEAPSFKLTDLPEPSFARIGVGLEATERDRAILTQAVPMAKQHNSELILIHVAEGMGPRFWSSESVDEEVRSDKGYLERLQQELQEQGLKVEIHLGFGEPARELVRLAEEAQLNLMVLGTHGHRFPQDILFGATATRVRHRLKIPVFMVRTDLKKS